MRSWFEKLPSFVIKIRDFCIQNIYVLMTKHICFEKAFSIVFFPLQFFDLMEHLHFSEEDQLVIGFQHQIIGQWVDHIVFCLFQFSVCPTKAPGVFILYK